MAEFAFTAQDRAGNAINGRVSADNPAEASAQIGQMGYTAVHVEAADIAIAAVEPFLPRQAPEPVSVPPAGADVTLTSRPDGVLGVRQYRPVDLSLPYSASLDLDRTLSSDSMPQAPAAHLEPWQRGGTVAEHTTMADTAVVAPSAVPMHHAPLTEEVSRSGDRYGVHYERQGDFVERFKEVMVYPVLSGTAIKDLAVMYRQFATLISAGIPLHQSLHSLEASTANRRLKEILQQAQRQVLAGGRLSKVLATYPWIFPPMHTELIRAAEEGGFMEGVLRQLADYVEHELELRNLIRRETLYPKIVLFVALMILGSGFPSHMAIVELVVGGDVMGYLKSTVFFGGSIVLGMFAVVAAFRLVFFNIPGVREIYDTFKINIPALGGLIRTLALAKFNRTFAALYRGGLGMISSLEIAGASTGNSVIANATIRAARQVETGRFASDSLQESGQFTPMAIDMLRTGETSGSMDMMADKLADYYENEGKLKAHQVAVIFTTIIFLIVAIMIGLAVITYYVGAANATLHATDGG